MMSWAVANARVEPKGNAIIAMKQASGAAKASSVEARSSHSLRLRPPIRPSVGWSSHMTGAWIKSLLRRTITLQAIITMVFALLILPALAIMIGFSFYENVRNLTALSNRFIDRASQDARELSSNLLQPVAEALRLMAGAEETTPGFFRSDESSNFLYDALISAPQIDAVYATFENGCHRVVTRVDDDRRRSDPRIPANAKWHT